MQDASFERIFKDVPREQREQLLKFRAAHPVKKLTVQGNAWDYLSGGQGEETLVLLTGGGNSSEAFFQIMTAFEPAYRVLALRYPCVDTVAQLVEGVAAILDAEHVQKAHLLGESLGGMVAQCLVRRYPERVETLILASTAAPAKDLAPYMRRQEKLVAFLPVGLVRWGGARRIANLLTTLPTVEAIFWSALMKEQIARYVTKAWLVSQYRLLTDYYENYRFTPDDLAGWPGAILILRADDDTLIRRLAPVPLTTYYPQASVRTFHNANHLAMITKQDEFIAAVKQFLAQQHLV